MHLATLWLRTCVFALLYGAVFAVSSSHVMHEKRSSNDDTLVKRERVQGHVELPVRIGLTQRNLELGHHELMAMSDPESPKFGQHYTAEQVEDFFAPSKDTVAAVRSWVEKSIHSHRVSISSNKQWLQFDATASELESLLKAEYYYYDGGSPGSEMSGIGCDKYHVPHEIREHIDYITPGIKLVGFEASPALQRRSLVTSKKHLNPHARPLTPHEEHLLNKGTNDCKFLITPDCVKQIYNINDNPPKASNNSIGTFNTATEYYHPKDLEKFLQKFTNIDPKERPTFHGIDGATLLKHHNADEANLDIQAVYSMAFPYAKIVYYQVDDPVYERLEAFSPFSGVRFSFNTFLDAIDGSYCNYEAFGIKGDSPGIDPTYPDDRNKSKVYKGKLQCGKFKPTKVISFSYALSELYYPMNYQRRQCSEFMKLGMQGTSLIFASGDKGVGAQYNPFPGDAMGVPCLRGKSRIFGPNAPTTCPYVTVVGGSARTQTGEEVAANDRFFSGGGFSNIYPRPEYQNDAVETFLTKYTPPYRSYNVTFKPHGESSGKYNRAGRGYPDISAIGQHFLSVSSNVTEATCGTSVSAQLFAGILARINAHRLAAGKGAVGFLNPTLYKHPEMFNDIVQGHNPNCRTEGFSCAPGWDPVTGLGSPNYPKMKKVLTSLP